MRYGIIALIAAVLLNGCARGTSNVAAQSKRLVLPDVVEYPIPLQIKAADEMDAGSCTILSGVFMPDYLVMRDQTRAARKGLK